MFGDNHVKQNAARYSKDVATRKVGWACPRVHDGETIRKHQLRDPKKRFVVKVIWSCCAMTEAQMLR